MFKWHFDDISLACLTFGEFHFSCALHLIHAEPFLIPSATKDYFFLTFHQSLHKTLLINEKKKS